MQKFMATQIMPTSKVAHIGLQIVELPGSFADNSASIADADFSFHRFLTKSSAVHHVLAKQLCLGGEVHFAI